MSFRPLPLDVFPEAARPHIARLNRELTDLARLKGALLSSVEKHSGDSVKQTSDVLVNINRITPDLSSVVAGTSTVIGAPNFTYGLTNVKGTTTTVVAVNSGVAFPLGTNAVWGRTSGDVVSVPFASLASVAGLSINAADTTKVLFNNAGAIGVDADFVWSGTALGVTGNINADTIASDGALGVTGRADIAGALAVGGACGVTGNLSTLGTLGVTGLATLAAGVTTSGVTTTNLMATGRADVIGALAVGGALGVTGAAQFDANTVIGTSMQFLLSGAGSPTFQPVTNKTVNIGRAIRRWGYIYGSTLNFSEALETVTGKITANISGASHEINPLVVGGQLIVTGSFAPPASGFGGDIIPNQPVYGIGQGTLVDSIWNTCMARQVYTAKGPDKASGQTIHISQWKEGNYYHVTGTASIEGFSTSKVAAGATDATGGWTAGVMILLKFNDACGLSHSSQLILSGSTDYTTSAGDLLEFVSEGGNVFREFNRHTHKLPAYGEISGFSASSVIAISNGGNVQVSTFDTNGLAYNTIPDHTNDHITVLTAGTYHIWMSASVSNQGGAAIGLEVDVAKNDRASTFDNLSVHRSLAAGTDIGSISVNGIVSLSANDTVEVWATSDSATERDVLFEDITLTVRKIVV